MENYITKYCPPTTEDAELEIDYKLSDVILVGEKTNVDRREKTYHFYLPLHAYPILDTNNKLGVWRAWSCLWLAHLLQKRITLLSQETMSNILALRKDAHLQCSKYGNTGRRQRGKYLSKRPKKFYLWKAIRESNVYSTCFSVLLKPYAIKH